MEKRKRWQLWLIIAVLTLTLYNILPTLFYYAKPLSQPINAPRAESIAQSISQRVDQLQPGAIAWTKALTRHLKLKPSNIEAVAGDDGLIKVTFPNAEQATTFAAVLPKAGSLIPFVPAQVSKSSGEVANPNVVYVQRNVDIALNEDAFQFTPKQTESGAIADLWATIVYDRAAEIATALGGITDTSRLVNAAPTLSGRQQDAPYLSLAQQIVEYNQLFGKESPITQRFYSGFTQGPTESVAPLMARLEAVRQHAEEELRPLEGEQLDPAKRQLAHSLRGQIQTVDGALAILRAEGPLFRKGAAPLNESSALAQLDPTDLTNPHVVQRIEIGDRNPFFKEILIDFELGQLTLALHADVEKILAGGAGEQQSYLAEKASQLVINEVASVGRATGEKIAPSGDEYHIALDNLTNSQSLLVLQLGELAKLEASNVEYKLKNEWTPESTDLGAENFPVYDYATFQSLPQGEGRLGFVIYAPSASAEAPPTGFRPGSLYVIGRGMGAIVERAQRAGESDEVKLLASDLETLQELMVSEGFFAYPGSSYGMPEAFRNDIIFEMDDFYSTLLKGTREEFVVHGSKRFATLDFSDVEQRIKTVNKIETEQHEDLLRWRDEYRAAKVSLDSGEQLFVPKPTQNALMSNLLLSAKKYFRGDERKILKWGLDLSGGKRVTIGLRDQNGKPVTDESDQRVAVNELYERVNKMGVSDVEIRIEGPNIVLNFPGAQNWSAAELIKASTMTFHIVNEKFSSGNAAVAREVDQFLQEVWNEAVVTGRKDIASINEIAWRNLGEDFGEEAAPRPRSESARILLENGLRLAAPESSRSTTFDDSSSAIAMWRVEDLEQQKSGHPLMIVFNNYVLEGSSLRGVQAQYDPSKGNVLLFDVASSNTLSDGTAYNPRSDFYLWTSQVAEEQIAGTPRAAYTGGRGWRMAVILNDQVISAPALHDALRDHAMISGSFSQREANQLASDLKAGSLSFTPQILSEQNVSPDLGLHERQQAMMAAAIGFLLLFALMIGYYRFAGVVASIAVVINLLIMWGILQNLEAALTLPGIAGVILAVGMSVDANVLVFERIREEFAQSGRLASAVQVGYRKAFSAIFDSNITTIIAALILMHFDSGPIKGFALTLIVGIVSSMFTALFMTRFYFAGWVAKHDKLTMANLFGKTKINFLSKAKIATICSGALIAVGLFVAVGESRTILGMDFTGGYALTAQLLEEPGLDYRAAAIEALEEAGATPGEIQIRELNRPNQLRIQLGAGMEESGHPFYGMPVETVQTSPFEFEYQSNPRIVWVVDALESGGLALRADSLDRLEDQWTAMSGQFSDAMRNAALFGLGLALICILAYITVRFEFKYAVSAIIALAHDVLITVGAIAILHRLGVPIQIDLQAVGALMTIVGYSLNDTIIIFDRIREDHRVLRKLSFAEMINHALNVTLNRTLMTSSTTLLVLLALVALGGSVIFGFALVMTMGILFGTFSSLFIASPALLYFHRREEAKSKRSNGNLREA